MLALAPEERLTAILTPGRPAMSNTLDPFTARLVALVRQLPDETILDLVRSQLGLDIEKTEAPAATTTPKRARRRGAKKAGSGK